MADFFGSRHILVILCFFGVTNVYFCRLNVSIAIISMSEPNIVEKGPGTSSSKNASRVYCHPSSSDITNEEVVEEVAIGVAQPGM